MNGDVCCVKEIRSAMERQGLEMHDGLIAYTHNYNLQTVLSPSKTAQETYWLLRNEEGHRGLRA